MGERRCAASGGREVRSELRAHARGTQQTYRVDGDAVLRNFKCEGSRELAEREMMTLLGGASQMVRRFRTKCQRYLLARVVITHLAERALRSAVRRSPWEADDAEDRRYIYDAPPLLLAHVRQHLGGETNIFRPIYIKYI